MRVRKCEVACGVRRYHTCGDTCVDVLVSVVARVEIFVSAVALYVCE